MKKLRSEEKLCLICMEFHDVDVVEVIDEEIYKDEKVCFTAIYEYCHNTDEYLETEEMIMKNSLAMKDAYRRKVGLLTSNEIIGIRENYGVSQKVFSEILGWGKATITRYENHHIQDRVHDDVLRKISSDPLWFLEMLRKAEENLPKNAFQKYLDIAMERYNKSKDRYLVDFILSIYAVYDNQDYTGGVQLNLVKVVEMINYYAQNIKILHKVKLMKLLWYADNLNYKRYGRAISGLVYRALPMGAVPEGHEYIISLHGVRYDIMTFGEDFGYRFKAHPDFRAKELTKCEIEVLDRVIQQLGYLNTSDIVEKMHGEVAYSRTDKYSLIPYVHAAKLTIE